MKLSIVTINLNNSNGLTKTIESVINQSFNDFEYLIIDGASNDGSVDIIRKYGDRINYWISEKDKGIYHAMNKGIGVAKGEYLLFLNSGDFLCNNSVLENFLNETNGTDIIYGRQYCEHPNGELVPYLNPDFLLIKDFFWGYSLPHQSTLIKRELFYKYGFYDESLKLSSDWKFFILAIFKWNCTYILRDMFVATFNLNGISYNPSYKSLQRKEMKSVAQSEFFFQYYEMLFKSKVNKCIYLIQKLLKL
jgi:glycosyltransferase involved in cell wall biosynthesis